MATARGLANQPEAGALAPPSARGLRAGMPVLVIPAALFLLMTFVYPVGLLLLRSLSFPTWGIQNYATIFQETLFLRVLANTVAISGAVTLITLLLG